MYGEYFFQAVEAFFPHKGVFFTKVIKAKIIAFIKAKIIAFIKAKILGPVLSVKHTPFKNVSP